MDKSMSRIMIETIVRRTLKDIQEAPERSTRNLLDMALQFSKGRFQKELLEAARRMLENENSAYYGLVRDVTGNVDNDRLLEFGMNLGYNSCTVGARMIREKEKNCGYRIPWSVILELDPDADSEKLVRYQQVIGEGEALGIFTWQLFAGSEIQNALELAERHSDSAFFIFCDPQAVTGEMIEYISALRNVALLLQFNDRADEACSRLRREKLLYGIYYFYDETVLEEITDGELFYNAQQLHPAAAVLVKEPSVFDELQKQVHAAVLQARSSQKYQTLIWELLGDNCFVDQIISDDDCFACFDEKGCLHTQCPGSEAGSFDLFHNSLQEIFAGKFPKREK